MSIYTMDIEKEDCITLKAALNKIAENWTKVL